MILYYQTVTWNILLIIHISVILNFNNSYSSYNDESQVTIQADFFNKRTVQNEHNDYSRQDLINVHNTSIANQPTAVSETEHERNIRLTINYRDTNSNKLSKDIKNDLCLFDELLQNFNKLKADEKIEVTTDSLNDPLPIKLNEYKSLLSQALRIQDRQLPDNQPTKSIVTANLGSIKQDRLFKRILQNTNDLDEFIIEVKHFSPILTEAFTNLKLAHKVDGYKNKTVNNLSAYTCNRDKLSRVLQVLFHYKFINDNKLDKMLKAYGLLDFRETLEYENLKRELQT